MLAAPARAEVTDGKAAPVETVAKEASNVVETAADAETAPDVATEAPVDEGETTPSEVEAVPAPEAEPQMEAASATARVAEAADPTVRQIAETAAPAIEETAGGIEAAAGADPQPLAEPESRLPVASARSPIREAAAAADDLSKAIGTARVGEAPPIVAGALEATPRPVLDLVGGVDLVGAADRVGGTLLDPLLTDGLRSLDTVTTPQPLNTLQPLRRLVTGDLPGRLVGPGSGPAESMAAGVVSPTAPPTSTDAHAAPPFDAGRGPTAGHHPALVAEPPSRTVLALSGAAGGRPPIGLNSVPAAGVELRARPTPTPSGEGPRPAQRPPTDAPGAGSGSGGSIFNPLVALLALLALAAPASHRRRMEAPDIPVPAPIVCALERPG
jgi:MYXO-CTERM domain-containing protein